MGSRLRRATRAVFFAKYHTQDVKDNHGAEIKGTCLFVCFSIGYREINHVSQVAGYGSGLQQTKSMVLVRLPLPVVDSLAGIAEV